MAVARGGARCSQSSELPLPAAPRRQAPGAAAGRGMGWGPQGPFPDPSHLGPIYEKKSRFQGVKPTLLHIQAQPSPHKNRRVNQVVQSEEPPSYRSWVPAPQLEVADWVFVWSPPVTSLQLWRPSKGPSSR